MNDLPDACVCAVLAFLSDEDLARTAQVSRRFGELSRAMRRAVDLRVTRSDGFVRKTILGKTGSMVIGLKRFRHVPPAAYLPITGFPGRFVSFAVVNAGSDDLYKCDLTFLRSLEVQPLFNRSVPIPHLAGIAGSCAFLETLIIPRAELPPEAVRALAGAPRLARLDMFDAKFAPETDIVFPRSLTDLDVSYCKFASHNIGALPNLTALNATAAGLDRGDLAALMGLTGLRSLDISWNHATEPVPDISALQRLERLAACVMVTGLDGRFSIPGLETLRNLTAIEMENCNLTSESVAWMAARTNMRSVNLSYNYIDSAGVAYVCASQLEKIDLSYNLIDDAGALVLAEQAALTYLDLDQNLITSVGARPLADMPLGTLVLARNLISHREARAILDSCTIPVLDMGRQRIED